MSLAGNDRSCNRPRPGPLYWDWRCLNCDQAISAHPSWWRRVLARLLLPSPESSRPDVTLGGKHPRTFPPPPAGVRGIPRCVRR